VKQLVPPPAPHHRVLIANDSAGRLKGLAALVAHLGHDPVVIAEAPPRGLSAACERLRPDLVVVGRGLDDASALGLISVLLHENELPVIAAVPAHDRPYLRRVAGVGAFACFVGLDIDELERAIEITLGRYAQYHGLRSAFARRATVERAKGVLMARYAIGEDDAFLILRRQARQSSRKLVDVAEAVVSTHEMPRARGCA
jgi:response regulator NasT